MHSSSSMGFWVVLLLVGVAFLVPFGMLLRGIWVEAPATDPAAPPASAVQRALQLTCPHCGCQAMSVGAKWALGWQRPAACRECGQRVANEDLPLTLLMGPPLLAVFLFALVWQLAPAYDFWVVGAAFLAVGCGVSLLLALVRPFYRCDFTDADAVERARARCGARQA